MSTIEQAVQSWTCAVETKLRDFSQRQSKQAELLAEVKTVLEAGRQSESKEDRDHRREFGAYLLDPASVSQLRRLREAQSEAKVISIGSDPNGGLAVPRTIQVAADVVAANLCPWMDPAVLGVQPIGPDFRSVYAYGSTVSRAAESDSRSATTTPTFRSVTPVHGEYYAIAQIYTHAYEDIQDVEAILATEFGRQLGAQLAADIWAGSGASGQIRGLTAVTPESSADDASPQRTEHALEYVPIVGNTSPLRVTTDDVANLLGSFSEEYLLSPGFCLVMRPTTWRSLVMNDGGTDAPFTMPRNPTLFGYPVRFSGAMPALATNALPIVAGDFKRAYALGQRGPLRVLADPYTTKGSILWTATVRYAGSPLNTNAAKALKQATS